MHRFRKNKKGKDASDELEKVSSTSSSPFSLKSSKKTEGPAESQFQLDLSDALPSSDDFRTSLLMPKLSARFSMLREQDDPDTVVGKASDDSVLFPKRTSRVNIFGNSAGLLTDIDEISSNDGSRPSIALGRADSDASAFDAGYGTDDDRSQSGAGGSIMSRARRTEGNNLFGGRQKVYRIPVRTPTGTGSESTEPNRGLGKFVYEHDLNMSAFQRLRLKEKEEQRRLAEEETDANIAQHVTTQESEGTASLSSRHPTHSLTASGSALESPASSGATSVEETPDAVPQASIHPDAPSDTRSPSAMSNPRNGSVRSQRLYGQGLNQTAQNQQSSTLNRLESLSRQRGSPATDSVPMNRNFSRSVGSLRDRLQKLNTTETTTSTLPASPPSSATSSKPPTIAENTPSDHALPLTNSSGAVPPLSPPSSEVDEGKRLLAAAVSPEDHGKATAMGFFNRAATGFDEQQFMRRQLQMHQGHNPSFPPPRPPPTNRPLPQEPSKSSHRSRAESASSNYSNGVDRSRASSVEASPGQPGLTTFYANSTASDSAEDMNDHNSFDLSSVTTMTTDAGHSLHQITSGPKPTSPINEPMDTLPEVRYSDLGDLKPIEEDEIPNEPSVPADGDLDTPQRPDSPTFGLNGFIRSHLRQVSDQSSICPPPSPGLTQKESTSNYLTTGEAPSELSTPATTPDEALLGLDHTTPPSPKPSSHHSSEHTANRSSGDSSNTSAANGVEYVHSNVSNWKDELQYGHRRGASTETQREREEFEIELAERRRKVQEKLRSVAESESRSTSPAPGRSTPDIGGIKAGNAFSILKHKAAKQGMGKPDLKGMMYGNNAGSTPALVSEDQWREEDRSGPNFGRHPNFSSPHVGSERSVRSRVPTVGRTSHEESRESSRSRGPSPHSGFRSRSGSDASGRSKSRTRYRERDDLETVNEAGSLPSETFVIPENYRPPLVPSSTRTSEDAEAMTYDRSTSAASGRYRSTSRSGAPGFQFERPFAYQQTQTSSMIGAPPRPPPAAPAYSANATPPLVEDQSPAGNPTAAVSSAHSLPQRTPGSNLLQKRSVNKKLISEPTLVSSTSNVPLVGLPVSNSTPYVSSQQGATPPPLPPMNPRRRRGTQTILSAFKSDKHDSRASSPVPSAFDEQSCFPDDEKRPRSRNRLRKSTSETGSLHARARQDLTDVPVPALPSNPPPPIPVNGGMF